MQGAWYTPYALSIWAHSGIRTNSWDICGVLDTVPGCIADRLGVFALLLHGSAVTGIELVLVQRGRHCVRH